MGAGSMTHSSAGAKFASGSYGDEMYNEARKYGIDVDEESFKGKKLTQVKRLLADITTRLDNVGMQSGNKATHIVLANDKMSKNMQDNLTFINKKTNTLYINGNMYKGNVADMKKIRSAYLSNVEGYTDKAEAKRISKIKATNGGKRKPTISSAKPTTSNSSNKKSNSKTSKNKTSDKKK